MQRTVIVLPDGSELSSGTGTVDAIQSVSITQCVNDSQELTLGSVCANMLEATLITPAGGLSLTAGDSLTVYREDGKARHKVGIFLLEKPTRPSANTMKLTAYDYITKLDRDLTGWLAGLTVWPYTMYQLAGMVCDQCGLTLANEQIPNGDHPVQMFSAEGITGRQLMKWIGEAAGRFCRATADGEVEFAWYTPAAVEIGPKAGGSVAFAGGQLSLTDAKASASGADGNVTLTSENITVSHDAAGNVTLTVSGDMDNLYYFQNGLRFEDYAVAPIEKVQIRQSSEDVGTIYPNEEGQKNTYIITGNSLLTASYAQDLRPIAHALYEQLCNVSYTPCSIQLPCGSGIEAGNTVTITDSNGKVVTAYVMTKKQVGQRDTLECTGSPRRDSTAAVNNQTYKALSGKVLNLRTDVEGLKVENADTKGNIARLQLSLEGISASVTAQNSQLDNISKQITAVEQTASSIDMRISQVEENGTSKVETETGYTFDKDGLRISKSGQPMENLLDNTGMYVKRSGDILLRANDKGVEAVDVTIRNYLIVGDHSRFEDYNGGTGCFWI